MLQEQERSRNPVVTKEAKLETQKLYRHAQQLSHRLDAKLVSAYEWKELFEPETLAFRQKLRDICESLLFTAPHEIARKAEEYLWRKVFYDIIQRLKQDKKALLKDEGLLAAYDAHIVGAIGFYNHLLMRLNQCFKINVHGTVDWFLDCSYFGYEDCKGNTEDFDVGEEHMSWALKACQRCLIYLGDLSRYHYDVFEGPCPELAERHYYTAVIMNPAFGMPHNQLGTLRQGIGFGCETVYHYMRCLLSPVSFEGAEENLKRMLEKHRQLMQQLTRERKLETLSNKDAFLCFFLKVQEYFCGYSSVPIDEITQTGHQALYSFSQMLDSAFSEMQTSGSGAEKIFSTQAVSTQCVVKLVCICIMNTCELKRKGIHLCTVALSYLIALATKILEQAVKVLKSLMRYDSIEALGETVIDSTTDSSGADRRESERSTMEDSNECSTDERLHKLRKKVMKMNKRRRRRKRRTRRLTNSEDEDNSENDSTGHGTDENPFMSEEDTLFDLSEGELDASLSSDDASSSEAEPSRDNNSCSEQSAEIFSSSVVEDDGKLPDGLSEGEKRNLMELGAMALQMSQEDAKSQRNKQKLTAWETAVKEQPGTEHLIERAIEDIHFPHALHNFCYFPVIKVFFDWLRCCYREFDFEDEVNRPLWLAVAAFLNILPPAELYVLAASHRKRLLDSLTAAANEGRDGCQKRALPEDMLVFGMTSLGDVHKHLDFSWTQTACNSHLFQCIARDRCIRDFSDFITSSEHPFLKFDGEKHRLIMTEVKVTESDQAPPKLVTHTPVHVSPSSAKKVDSKNKSKEFMKALAKQKLEFDVYQLETNLEATRISNSNLSAYLVMETQALCRHLSLIRSLLKSGEFIIVIPKQVISALDDLKKYNPGAREAIKFLEEEFRHGNRWLKSQDDAESINEDILSQGQKKNKSLSVDDWRFFQIVRCACYYGRQVKAERLVSILTSDQFQQNGLGHSGIRLFPQVIEFCQESGVQLQSAVDFYKRWTAVRK